MAPPPPSSADAGILVITAHPQMEQSRINRRLMRCAAREASEAVPGMVVRDLYALYPDYLIDVQTEQALLANAKLVIWQHPIHWYNMPPLMKLWLDDVFTFGWAYGPDGDALAGKDLWLVATTGGPEESYRPESYNRYPFDAFLPPYRQTAELCGMRFLPPLVLHGAHKLGEPEIAAYEKAFVERLRSYPNWPEIADLNARAGGDVPETARPADAMVDAMVSMIIEKAKR